MIVSKNTEEPPLHFFQSDSGQHVLLLENSQIFDLPNSASHAQGQKLVEPYLKPKKTNSIHSLPQVAPQSISLNVSSSCNLSCQYCYAARGGFDGKQRKLMCWQTARAAVDRLLSVCEAQAPVTIGFLGGEPFANAKLIHKIVNYASMQGNMLDLDVRFSVTTNGTLLSAEDIKMLRHYPFAVTISVDGGKEIYEQLRIGTTFEKFTRRIKPLLQNPGMTRISARSTITRSSMTLSDKYDAIHHIGFSDIGFSPTRVSPDGSALTGKDWSVYLNESIKLGKREIKKLKSGKVSGFSNLVIALKQIHRGSSSPYPCGAGGGYFSVSSGGAWYACHRAIGEKEYELGNNDGLYETKRVDFLLERHVDRQTDCQTCWARYLCSGSCHQEAKSRSAESCDFIRGWLDFCLASYCELTQSTDWETLMEVYDER